MKRVSNYTVRYCITSKRKGILTYQSEKVLARVLKEFYAHYDIPEVHKGALTRGIFKFKVAEKNDYLTSWLDDLLGSEEEVLLFEQYLQLTNIRFMMVGKYEFMNYI